MLTSDEQYLCSAYGTQLPLLPVHGNKEQKVFTKLVLAQDGSSDIDQMAID